MIVRWWEPEFPAYVICVSRDGSLWVNWAQKLGAWLEENYPSLKGDMSVGRMDAEVTPYYEYDWGFTTSSMHSTSRVPVFYFKDPNVAMHFKLVWA